MQMKLNEIIREQQAQRVMINKLFITGSSCPLASLPDDISLPIKSFHEITEIEEKLKDVTIKNALVTTISLFLLCLTLFSYSF